MRNKEIMVGIFAVVALTLLYLGFYYLKGIDFLSTTKNYYAKYNNISQLAVSNPVLVNGFAVGRVSNIQLMEEVTGNQVLVELEINSKITVGKGAKATLNSDFLGSKSIVLDLGDYTKPLRDKDTIQTDVAKGIFDMFSDAAEPVADNLSTTLRKMNTLMDNLDSSLAPLQVVIKRLQSTPDKINNTLDIAGNEIIEIKSTIKSVADKLNSTMAQLDPTLKNFKTFSDSLNQLKINETFLKVSTTLNSLNESLDRLKKGDNTAGKLLTEDSLYVNLNKVLKSIDSLANHFNTHPKHFLSPLGKSSKKIERDYKKENEK